MNHMVFSMLNQKSRENVGVKYENKKPSTKLGVFSGIIEEVPTQINATMVDEHDVEIIQALLEPVSVSPPHTELVTTSVAEEDATTDLPPRKRSKRDPRISGEENTELRTTTELTLPVTTARPSIHYTLSPLNPRIINFIQNERAEMYMPVPNSGEGSSSGPSDVDVIRATELLQAAAREVEAAAKTT
ncbi:hypothetical protein Hanom_Chr02g00133471 [Helianthus anomalus]